jgi:putative ABC transport system permease protein
MELIYGENFKTELGEANIDNVIINETAMEYAGWDGNPIGKTIRIQRENDTQEIKTVIGVVKDFNFTSTRRTINPMFLDYSEENFSFLVRISENQGDTFLAAVEDIYLEFYPEANFRATYLDDVYNFQFRQDQAFAGFITVFSIIAIIISCLGLLGLSSYMTEQRTKEIGIRKVLGSSVMQIVTLLSVDFTRWVVLANFIAWPLTWYAMNLWLNEFVYRMNMNIGIFLVSGLAVITIALLTIGLQTIRAANANPVKALNYE